MYSYMIEEGPCIVNHLIFQEFQELYFFSTAEFPNTDDKIVLFELDPWFFHSKHPADWNSGLPTK